ncbi:transposable element Tcb1 transposase [Trichonephila clavipes]|uniref:Transposable element Tcb1 transposase n=1 Tax=Trichonephila clavipes TaxID=2585209 RepID=A0A8X7BF86_TRICX|nr:transposable element Tcb1 transposase [Trichonephila clavipes]
MSRRKQRSGFDQVSEFDRARIVAYRHCGLSFSEIGSRVGRNQTNVIRICDRWIQEVSARTIRRRLQQSGPSIRRQLLGLPLTQNHRRLRRQWCDERMMWEVKWKEVVCLQHHDGRIRVWRHRRERMLNSCVMHRHTGPAPGIMDNARPHVTRIIRRSFVNLQIEWLPWPTHSPDVSPTENMWYIVAQRFTQITPPAATPDQLWQRVEAAWSAVPQEYI